MSKDLNAEFLRAVREGNSRRVDKLVDQGADVNYQDEHGMTALHWAAAIDARPTIRVLLKHGTCDYLRRDKQNRYASEYAFEQARDYAVGILLVKKEAKQAREQGIQAWPKRTLQLVRSL